MNETKTKQSVTQQKSNWKPWQIVLVILLGLCALPVVVPVGFGLLAAAVGIAVALGAERFSTYESPSAFSISGGDFIH